VDSLLQLALALCLLALLLKFRVELGWALFIVSTMLAFCSGLKPFALLGLMGKTAANQLFLEIIVVLFLINILEELLRENGYLDRMLASLKSLIGNNKIIVAIFPFIIGLLPSVGGARFSAPMVEAAGKNLKLSAVDKTLLNYWFRHVWDYYWPLIPGVILAAYLLQMKVGAFILYLLPLAVVSFVLGYFFFVRPIEEKALEKDPQTVKGTVNRRILLVSFWPLLAILIPVIGLKLPLIPILVLVNSLLFLGHKMKLRLLPEYLRKNLSFRLAWMCYGVFLLKTVFEGIKMGEELPLVFMDLCVPPLVLILALPFIIGLLSGMISSYVGIVFPILMPFFMVNGSLEIGLAVAAFAAGHAGSIFSPAHLCMVFSLEYFDTDYLTLLRRLLLPECLLQVAALIWGLWIIPCLI
jgi:integral membrane protein (TIGR00529 family)